MTVEETIVARQLRNYYNEICEVMEDLEQELIDLGESERILIRLDEKYSAIIVKELT